MVARARRFLADNARDLTGLVGLALTTIGASHVYPPAGYLVPGVFLLASAILWRYR